MNIATIKTLQGKITKKFKVYTSFQLSQGYRQDKTLYTSLTVYDEIHTHRTHKTFVSAVEELSQYLDMTEQQFKYETAKVQAKYKLDSLKSARESICDEIAELEATIQKIELKEEGL